MQIPKPDIRITVLEALGLPQSSVEQRNKLAAATNKQFKAHLPVKLLEEIAQAQTQDMAALEAGSQSVLPELAAAMPPVQPLLGEALPFVIPPLARALLTGACLFPVLCMHLAAFEHVSLLAAIMDPIAE